jgi:3-oxoacyl-[acyl-carrier-protein] synthase-1
MLAVLKTACEKEYSKGRHILAHLTNDDGERSAIILSWQTAI